MSMSGARSRKMRGSLGDSWGDADYSSDGGASVHSASDFSGGSESGYDVQDEDMATPLPPRFTRATSHTPQDTPTQQKHRPVPRHAQPSSNISRSSHSTPESAEPSFIMPSMSGSVSGHHDGSPLRSSQIRNRKARQTSQRQSGGVSSSRVASRRTSARAPSYATEPAAEDISPWHYINLFRAHFVWPLVRYVLDVVGYAMNQWLKPILATGLAAFLILTALRYSSVFLQQSFQNALTPICIIPGSSYLLPFCATSDDAPHPDFEELVNVQNTFEDVLEANKDSYALPATMKKGEMAIRDLRSLVKYSNLPSRRELEVEFTTFIETANEASEYLAKYNGKIGYTMDQVISTNRWTLTVLEGIASQDAGAGSLSRALSAVNPLSLFYAAPDSLEQRIFEQYISHVAKIKGDIMRLIDNSVSLIALLNRLGDQLDIIADVAIRDDLSVSREHTELLSQLWTILGGNRASKKELQHSLGLLRNVLRYKKMAVEHVTATLLKLQEIEAGLENLREGVGAPEVLGWRSEVPLQWHIEVVGKSVERLRDVRGETLALERDAVRKGLSDDDGGGWRNLPGAKETPTVYAKVGHGAYT